MQVTGANSAFDGTIVNYTDYDAYGNAITQSGGSINPGGMANGGVSTDISTSFAFGAGYWDASNLTYLVHRYLDNETGQFISVDPLVDQTREAYVYAGDGPVMAIDALGLSGWICVNGKDQFWKGTGPTTGKCNGHQVSIMLRSVLKDSSRTLSAFEKTVRVTTGELEALEARFQSVQNGSKNLSSLGIHVFKGSKVAVKTFSKAGPSLNGVEFIIEVTTSILDGSSFSNAVTSALKSTIIAAVGWGVGEFACLSFTVTAVVAPLCGLAASGLFSWIANKFQIAMVAIAPRYDQLLVSSIFGKKP